MWRQYVSVLCAAVMMAQPVWANYNPRLGRFLQRDQVGAVNPATITPLVDRGAAFVPNHGVPEASAEYRQGPNLYQYVQGRPLTRTDPSGRFSLISILGATGLRVEASRQVLDAGEIVMDGAVGLTGLVMTRDLIMGALAGAVDDADLNTFDDILLGHRILQAARTGMMVAGALAMTGSMLHAGMRGLNRLSNWQTLKIAARKISRGHAWRKHRAHWDDLGIRTVRQFEAYINAMMVSLPYKRCRNGRRAWWDSERGVVIIFDPGHLDLGSAFRPNKNKIQGKIYFDTKVH